MRIAVLGGTRFIGRAAALLAHSRGHEVVLLHRGQTPSDLPFVREVHVDRDDGAALRAALSEAKPDALLDTCAMTAAHAQAMMNAVADVVSGPLVVLSSLDVYAQFGLLNGLPGPAPESAVREDSPKTIPFPFRNLGGHEGGPDYDKKEVERIYQDHAETSRYARVVALRLPGVYGARDPKRRFASVVDPLDAGETELVTASGPSLRLTHAHVQDVAHAILLSLEKAPLGFVALNVGEAKTPSMRERATAIASAMGCTLSFHEDDTGREMGLLGAFSTDCIMDTTKIRSLLGYRELLTDEQRLTDTISALRASRGLAS